MVSSYLIRSSAAQRGSFVCSQCSRKRAAFLGLLPRRTLRTRRPPSSARSRFREQEECDPRDLNTPQNDRSTTAAAIDRLEQRTSVPSPVKEGFRSWKGLKRMTPQEWDARAATQYTGFGQPNREVKDEKVIEFAVRRAVIEVLTTRQEEQTVESVSLHRETTPINEDLQNAKFNSPENVSALDSPERGKESTFHPSNDDIVQKINAKPDLGGFEAEDLHTVDLPNEAEPEMDQSWKELSLADPFLKFAVIKRTSQLLGSRIPDPAVASIQVAADMVQALLRKPRPAKLQKVMREKGILTSLKNVEWGAKSQNDRDREVGSLKVIKAEVEKIRLMSPKQRAWALGG